MDTDWTVVTLAADDYDDVRGLWEESGLPVKPGGRDSREQFAQQLAGGTQVVLGLRSSERLIGVVVVTHDGRKGWINRLAVHPDTRRQGAGQRLIIEAERVLREQGMHVIAVLIAGGNEASLALFERAGYTVYPGVHYLTKRDSQDV
ncbi:MAG: GNAT family N-acetyltransferase [Anaerolineae bacterium]|nr:GNAT family N-acetyltransferase [Anaerolineae bacterium]